MEILNLHEALLIMKQSLILNVVQLISSLTWKNFKQRCHLFKIICNRRALSPLPPRLFNGIITLELKLKSYWFQSSKKILRSDSYQYLFPCTLAISNWSLNMQRNEQKIKSTSLKWNILISVPCVVNNASYAHQEKKYYLKTMKSFCVKSIKVARCCPAVCSSRDFSSLILE